MKNGHTESDIVIPAIKALRVLRNQNDFVATAALIKKLTATLDLNAYDNEMLPSDNTPRIERIIRNLKSHKTLLNMGMVTHVDKGFILTEKGKKLPDVELRNELVEYAKTPGAFSSPSNGLTNEKALQKVLVIMNLSLTLAGKFNFPADIDKLPLVDTNAERMAAIQEAVTAKNAEKPHFFNVLKKGK